MNLFNNLAFSLFLVSLLTITDRVSAADISGYRDTAERVQKNKGIELVLFKKMTEAKMEHFSVRNTTSRPVSDISGYIIYKDMYGEQITSQPFEINATLVPGAAKLTSITSFDQEQKYSFHLNFDPRGIPPGVIPFMVELADISYKVISSRQVR